MRKGWAYMVSRSIATYKVCLQSLEQMFVPQTEHLCHQMATVHTGTLQRRASILYTRQGIATTYSRWYK